MDNNVIRLDSRYTSEEISDYERGYDHGAGDKRKAFEAGYRAGVHQAIAAVNNTLTVEEWAEWMKEGDDGGNNQN